MLKNLLLIMALAFVLGACSSNRETGALVGGTSGAGLGALISGGGAAGIVIGGLAGIIVGSEIGHSMDKRDRQQIARSLENSPSGSRNTWVNPDNGSNYSVTPQAANTGADGQPCRDFVLNSDEFDNPVYSTACRRADGTWHIKE